MAKKSLDLSRLIIYSALIVTAARYAGAFLASDLGEVTGFLSDGITFFMVVSGIGMGVLDVIGVAYIADSWRGSLPRSGRKPGARFFILTGFLVSLMLSGVGILAPFTVARVNRVSIGIALPGGELYFWAVLVNIAPYLIVSGVMIATSHILAVPESDPVAPAALAADAAGPARTTVIDARTTEICNVCGAEYRSKAAHYRWKHPEMTKGAK